MSSSRFPPAGKSILKKTPSQKFSNKTAKYDEENVAATYGPGLVDKDYGHMKIDEAKTPYEREVRDSDDETGQMQESDKSHLQSQIEKLSAGKIDRDFDRLKMKEETAEERKAKDFENKRKMHYNMKEQMLRARQLMEEEDDDD